MLCTFYFEFFAGPPPTDPADAFWLDKLAMSVLIISFLVGLIMLFYVIWKLGVLFNGEANG